MKKLIIITLSLFFTNAAYAESYLCISDQSTGFWYNKQSKEWVKANFKSGDKFLVKQIKGEWRWTRFGLEDNDGDKTSCSGFNDYGLSRCSSSFQTITFSRKSLRFEMHTFGTYAFNTASLIVTPGVIIGTCSAL